MASTTPIAEDKQGALTQVRKGCMLLCIVYLWCISVIVLALGLWRPKFSDRPKVSTPTCIRELPIMQGNKRLRQPGAHDVKGILIADNGSGIIKSPAIVALAQAIRCPQPASKMMRWKRSSSG